MADDLDAEAAARAATAPTAAELELAASQARLAATSALAEQSQANLLSALAQGVLSLCDELRETKGQLNRMEARLTRLVTAEALRNSPVRWN